MGQAYTPLEDHHVPRRLIDILDGNEELREQVLDSAEVSYLRKRQHAASKRYHDAMESNARTLKRAEATDNKIIPLQLENARLTRQREVYRRTCNILTLVALAACVALIILVLSQ